MTKDDEGCVIWVEQIDKGEAGSSLREARHNHPSSSCSDIEPRHDKGLQHAVARMCGNPRNAAFDGSNSDARMRHAGRDLGVPLAARGGVTRAGCALGRREWPVLPLSRPSLYQLDALKVRAHECRANQSSLRQLRDAKEARRAVWNES
jgi:hypothetical protein